jgi:hypothetical protein
MSTGFFRKGLGVLVAGVLLFGMAGVVGASESDIKKELDALKQKVLDLETKLEKTQEEASKQREEAAKEAEEKASEKAEGSEERKPHLAEIREEIKEKTGLELHGGVVTFYQGAVADRIGGEKVHDASGAGVVTDLELTWKPGMPLFENGRFFVRAHYGEGQGADKDLGDKLFAGLNTIGDDSDDDDIRVLEAYYAHEFCDGKLLITLGKTEPLVFIDGNALANDEASQFVGKPFVNNPMLDSEDEYGPIAATSFTPVEGWTFTVLGASTSWANAPERRQKNIFDNIFDGPLVAGQITYSPKFGELQGNYGVYGWDAMYDHRRLTSRSSEDGWGVGLSADQQVTEKLGLFARVGYSNEDVYEVDWFWLLGASLTGLVPSRKEDTLGLALAGLEASDELDEDGTEFHVESYYRFFITENFAISPDFQYVANPRGDSDNDDVFAWMVRGEFSF